MSMLGDGGRCAGDTRRAIQANSVGTFWEFVVLARRLPVRQLWVTAAMCSNWHCKYLAAAACAQVPPFWDETKDAVRENAGIDVGPPA